jgi:hypothetical protein
VVPFATEPFPARPFVTTVNSLVTMGPLTTSFDPEAVTSGSAGTFTIRASFSNASGVPIVTPVFVVTELSDGNLLLNADSPPGATGARLTPSIGDGVLLPGDSFEVEFAVGLQDRKAFIFLVELLGGIGP